MHHRSSRSGFVARVALAALLVACGDARSRTPAAADTASARLPPAALDASATTSATRCRFARRRAASSRSTRRRPSCSSRSAPATDSSGGRTSTSTRPPRRRVPDLGNAMPPNVESVLGVASGSRRAVREQLQSRCGHALARRRRSDADACGSITSPTFGARSRFSGASSATRSRARVVADSVESNARRACGRPCRACRGRRRSGRRGIRR